MANRAEVKIDYVHVDRLHEFEGNPQEQSREVFNNLVQEIETDGFDEPLQVVPAPDIGPNEYRIVSGNHRFKAAKILDYEELPVIVKNNWDELTAKIKVIRRNRLKGELDPTKFTRFVNELIKLENLDQEVLQEMMGFTDLDEMLEYYQTEKKKTERQAKSLVSESNNQLKLIDNLSFILNRLFTDYGDTVPLSFMFFCYGKKMHVMVQMNSKLKRMIEKITQKCVQDGLDINTILPGLLDAGMEHTSFLEGPPEIEDIEERANNEEDDSELDPAVGPPIGL